ncbi:MAG: hypothetical protein K2Z81_06325 [Cyanobacteria bacterium]|nr:hypothetical protein [Cyanobacteriota bacterium]
MQIMCFLANCHNIGGRPQDAERICRQILQFKSINKYVRLRALTHSLWLYFCRTRIKTRKKYYCNFAIIISQLKFLQHGIELWHWFYLHYLKNALEESQTIQEQLSRLSKDKAPETSGKAYLLYELANACAVQNRYRRALPAYRQAINTLSDIEPSHLAIRRTWLIQYEKVLRESEHTEQAREVAGEIREIDEAQSRTARQLIK